jgi:hypothetical protein
VAVGTALRGCGWVGAGYLGDGVNKHLIRSEGEALVYIVDCTLATVCIMAMKKRPPVYEFKRHIMIAQSGVDWIKQFGLDPRATRSAEVINNFDSSVEKWAEYYRPLDAK